MNRYCVTSFSAIALILWCAAGFAQSLGNAALETANDEFEAADILREGISASASSTPALKPFGARLFHGGFSGDREDGINPSYIIKPGDRLSVRIWGATEFNDQLLVDHQGNIFIPSVGPIPVAGVSNRRLNDRVAKAISRVFTDNVNVYTSLDGSQPVAVFVTGYVVNPGRFAGIPSNSVLYFLDRAGGIDTRRGSYRRIRVQRSGRSIAQVDLYDFLRNGQLSNIQFQDGDTIVVERRGPVVSVSGSVNNEALFEFDKQQIKGRDLADLAMPEVGVSHASVSGIRDQRPWSDYLRWESFQNTLLADGDQVNFYIDQNDSVIVVGVEGAHEGPSRFAVPRNTRLHDLLDYIEVDHELADFSSVSLRRQQIAVRQQKALDESLRRLQARYLTASSQTDAESAIRAREAELISQFVQSAGRVKPNGRLVVSRKGVTANVLLQSGDTITIPSRSESVLLSGEVLISQAVLFEPGLRALDYIERSGGFSSQANTERLVVVHANGAVSSGRNPAISLGDEIIVLPRVPVKNLQIASTIVDIIYKVAVAASVAINL